MKVPKKLNIVLICLGIFPCAVESPFSDFFSEDSSDLVIVFLQKQKQIWLACVELEEVSTKLVYPL